MTNISKSHQEFSKYFFNNPKFLTHPQEFLGPNFEAVLNFWMILDDLSKDQWEVIVGRYRNFYDYQPSDWKKATDEAREASREAIGIDFANNAARTPRDIYSYTAACYATRELIGIHLLLDQQKPLTFFQMFLEVL